MTSVEILRSGGYGTGVFIDDDVVLTCGHAVLATPGSLDPASIRVRVPGGFLGAKQVVCLPRWQYQFQGDSDMAMIRTVAPRKTLVVKTQVGARPNNDPVTVVGSSPYTGHVTRVADPDGLDQLSSADLIFPSGVSGAPVVAASGRVIGVATRSPPQAGAAVYIGLPLLDSTFGWLLKHI
jgi:hypothetical protein